MQTANAYVHLGGDSGTTVPKYGLTVSEIAVLQAIHGRGAVIEVEPAGEINRSDREEIGRLTEIYGRAMIDGPNGKVSVVQTLFPGAAARAFQTLDQLDIPEDCFKATGRMTAAPAEKPRKGKKAAEPEQPAAQPAEEDDGVAEMPDVGLFR